MTISIKKTEDVCVDEKKKLDGDGAVVLMVVHIIRKQNDEHAQSEKKRESDRATEKETASGDSSSTRWWDTRGERTKHIQWTRKSTLLAIFFAKK